jgi:hypothetical protein
MRLNRWLNPSLPQTLQIATFLFYINAAFSVIYGVAFNPIGLVLTVGSVFAGLGIANELKWGYVLGVAIAVLGLVPFFLLVRRYGLDELFNFNVILSLIFPVALFLLVIHPESRSYQKIWFS